MCILTHILKAEEMSGRSHFHMLMMKSKRTNKRNINIVNSLILQTDFVYIWFLIFIREESIPSSGGFRYKQIRMNECMRYVSFPHFWNEISFHELFEHVCTSCEIHFSYINITSSLHKRCQFLLASVYSTLNAHHIQFIFLHKNHLF